jgi:hypothetical protein
MTQREAEVICNKLNQFVFTPVCTPPQLENSDMVILDSGCTSNLLTLNEPCTIVQSSVHTILAVNMPNSNKIQPSHISELTLMALPVQARKVHIFPGLAHTSFLSFGQLCNMGCEVVFSRANVIVTKGMHDILAGICDAQSGLWRVNLKPPETQECGHAYKKGSKKNWIRYMHAACFSPVARTKQEIS